MKQSSLTAKLHKAKNATHNGSPRAGQAQHAPPERGWARGWKWVLALMCIVLAAGVSYAVLHFIILTRIPHQMVGTWVVIDVKSTESNKADEALKGGRLAFQRDGTMICQANMDGKGYTVKATVEVEGETLRIISVNPNDGQKATDVQTIRALEGDRFVIENRQGTVLVMERLRE